MHSHRIFASYVRHVIDTCRHNHGKRNMHRLVPAIAACHLPLNVTSCIE